MKKLILAMAFFYALLLPCFSQKEKEAYRYLKNKISEETEMEESMEELIKIFEDHILRDGKDDKDHIVDIKVMRNIYLFKECYVFVIQTDDIVFGFGYKQKNVIKFYKTFAQALLEFDERRLFPYQNTILEKQINQFRYKTSTAFFYDFNHDGNDDILTFYPSGIGLTYVIKSFDFLRNQMAISFYIVIPLPSVIPAFEFILFKGRQGIKVYEHDYSTDNNEWCFYYYDRIQQKYVQDESASSEELEQIHGSPDFFAEAGIDYAKLERPLLPADLEGFSKAALRIWRNAVYARHGRTFKSEDLQALFNEYAWYKPDNEYTDDKLTDIDRANIKLIQEFEQK